MQNINQVTAFSIIIFKLLHFALYLNSVDLLKVLSVSSSFNSIFFNLNYDFCSRVRMVSQ